MGKIEKYINKIEVWKTYSYTQFKEVEEYKFLGDGHGDYEEFQGETTEECLLGYIEYCKEQIKLAKKALENING